MTELNLEKLKTPNGLNVPLALETLANAAWDLAEYLFSLSELAKKMEEKKNGKV